MTKHTNEHLRYHSGMIYTATGVSIARMDRGEPYTSPTERDANARRFVQIWNLWPDVVAFLQDLHTRHGYYRLEDDTRELVWNLLKRIREEVS